MLDLNLEALSDLTPQQAESALSELLDVELAAASLRAQALTKQQEMSALLDEADALEFRGRLRRGVGRVGEPIEGLKDDVSRLQSAVDEAIAFEREAEDAAREASDNHQVARDAEREAVRGRLRASEQTDALLRVRAAGDVSGRARAAHEGATAAREAAVRDLDAARRALTTTQDAYAAAQLAADGPVTAPTSGTTALMDGWRRAMMGQPMDASALGIVKRGVLELARKLGVEREIKNIAKGEYEKDLAERRSAMMLPKAGHSTRP